MKSAELPTLVIADSEATAYAAMQDNGLHRLQCEVVCSLSAAQRRIRGTRGRRYMLALRRGASPVWWPEVMAMLAASEAVSS